MSLTYLLAFPELSKKLHFGHQIFDAKDATLKVEERESKNIFAC